LPTSGRAPGILPANLQGCIHTAFIICGILFLRLTADMQQDPLSIQVRQGKSPDTRVLTFEGPITLSNLFTFQAELRKESPPLTILDFSGVPYMDSAGMGAVINCYISAQKNGRKIVLVGVNERIYALLELTNTVKLLKIAPSVEEAE
jgi:anti-sigma B factor antagonist